MSADLTWKLNGVDLDATPGFLTSVGVWRPNISTRRTPVEIPGWHGTVDPGLPVFAEPTVTLSVRMTEKGQAALERTANALAGLLAEPALTLTRISGGIETTAVARLVSASFEDFLFGQTERAVAVLAIPGVFFREPAQTTAQQAFSADLANVAIAHLAGSSAPVTDAVAQVQGPATGVSVTDVASGTGISWAGTLAAGAYLCLAPGTLRGWISASATDWQPAGTDVTTGVDYPARGPLQLWPMAAGAFTDRQVRFSASGTGRTTATRIAIRAGRSFL